MRWRYAWRRKAEETAVKVANLREPDIHQQIARCDREIEQIRQMGETEQHPAWLVHLGLTDWECEREYLLRQVDARS